MTPASAKKSPESLPNQRNAFRCLFEDYPGLIIREVWLDCLPEVWTRVEGQTRRTWRRAGSDRDGVPVYVEAPPTRYQWGALKLRGDQQNWWQAEALTPPRPRKTG